MNIQKRYTGLVVAFFTLIVFCTLTLQVANDGKALDPLVSGYPLEHYAPLCALYLSFAILMYLAGRDLQSWGVFTRLRHKHTAVAHICLVVYLLQIFFTVFFTYARTSAPVLNTFTLVSAVRLICGITIACVVGLWAGFASKPSLYSTFQPFLELMEFFGFPVRSNQNIEKIL